MAESVDASLAVGHVFPPCPCSYNARDAMLYALGIGCTVEGGDGSELRHLYELADDFAPFPTLALTLGFRGLVGHDAVPYPPPHGAMGQIPPGIPAIDPSLILHAEQEITFKRRLPMPLEAPLQLCTTVVGLHSRGSGLLMTTEGTLTGADGEVYATTTEGTFLRMEGGSGEKLSVGRALASPAIPTTPPTATRRLATSRDQALMFRLSGDYNPLHADPQLAKMVGFERPILHGLCTLGFATRHVVAQACPGESERLLRVGGRFSSPCVPGEVLETQIWYVDERGQVVECGGGSSCAVCPVCRGGAGAGAPGSSAGLCVCSARGSGGGCGGGGDLHVQFRTRVKRGEKYTVVIDRGFAVIAAAPAGSTARARL